MLLAHYYAGVLGAGALTAAWLFRPADRTAATSLSAFVLWTLLAVFGADTETYADGAATVQTVNNTTLAVPQGEQLVAAPLPTEFRLFALLWALLSVLAFILYTLGVYPPDDATGEGPTEVR
jgi:hypothetical protein